MTGVEPDTVPKCWAQRDAIFRASSQEITIRDVKLAADGSSRPGHPMKRWNGHKSHNGLCPWGERVGVRRQSTTGEKHPNELLAESDSARCCAVKRVTRKGRQRLAWATARKSHKSDLSGLAPVLHLDVGPRMLVNWLLHEPGADKRLGGLRGAGA